MNITLRRMQSSDADALYRLLSDSVVMRYLEPTYDRAQAEAFLRRAGLAEPPLVYAVQEDEHFIGYVTTRTLWKLAGCCSRNTGGVGMRRN